MSWTCQVFREMMEVAFGKFLAINVHLWRFVLETCF